MLTFNRGWIAVKAPDWSHDNDALEAMIRDAVAAERDTPTISTALRERMTQAAKSAYVWRTVDDELERLSLESDTALEAAVRASDTARVLQFRGAILTLDLEVTDRSIVGQVYPTQSGTVTFTPASGPAVHVDTDEIGCFTIERPTGGPFRLRCDTPGSTVVTDWLT